MRFLLSSTVIGLFIGSAALAEIDTNALVAGYQDLGYTRVEIKVGPTQTKVEAIRGQEKVEVVYDNSTGDVLKSEVEAVEPGDDTAAGVEIDTKDKDFVDGRDHDDDDDDSDNNSGPGGGSDDDDDDDNSGSGSNGSDDDHDNSGPGSGGSDDDRDNSGSGSDSSGSGSGGGGSDDD